jgi:hypothetical protein
VDEKAKGRMKEAAGAFTGDGQTEKEAKEPRGNVTSSAVIKAKVGC